MSLSLKEKQKQLYQTVLARLQDRTQHQIAEAEVRVLVGDELKKQNWLLPENERTYLVNLVTFSITGLGPLEFYLRDSNVSEIMVNAPDQIFIEKAGKIEKAQESFNDDEQVIQVINRIVGQIGRRIDESQPLVDGRLPDGSRINAIIPPLALNGPTLTIRKFPEKAFTINDMLDFGTLNPEMAEFIDKSVKQKKNILISGGTGTGKTSTLNALASCIPKNERIITIEDAAEIRIDHPHLITLETRKANIEGSGEIDMRTLVKNALRMRPDRIVVGEIRGGEAIDMLQAMNTGHQGSLTTLHANAPFEALMRLETMVLMGGLDLPLSAIKPQIIQAIDLVIQQERLSTGERKVTDISEVIKSPGQKEYELKKCF